MHALTIKSADMREIQMLLQCLSHYKRLKWQTNVKEWFIFFVVEGSGGWETLTRNGCETQVVRCVFKQERLIPRPSAPIYKSTSKCLSPDTNCT